MDVIRHRLLRKKSPRCQVKILFLWFGRKSARSNDNPLKNNRSLNKTNMISPQKRSLDVSDHWLKPITNLQVLDTIYWCNKRELDCMYILSPCLIYDNRASAVSLWRQILVHPGCLWKYALPKGKIVNRWQ